VEFVGVWLVGEQINIIGWALDEAVQLHCISSSERESEAADSAESDAGNAFMKRVHSAEI